MHMLNSNNKPMQKDEQMLGQHSPPITDIIIKTNPLELKTEE